MFESLFLIGKRGPAANQPEASFAVPDSARPETTTTLLLSSGPLDAVGEQSENVRERVNGLSERLHDLQSLSTDFEQIVEPLNSFITQHAASRAKLLEVEALLERERELSAAVRSELEELQVAAAKASSEYAELIPAFHERENTIRDQKEELAQLRIKTADLTSRLEGLDNQLFAETERVRSTADENQSLRGELETAEEARSRAESQLGEARELIALSEAECSRLQHLSEGLTRRIGGLKSNIFELEPQLQQARQDNAALQARFVAEQSARQKSESARETERSERELEIASLSMKIDSLNAHVVNTDKLLVHLREQLREKSEALRAEEKTLKEALGERQAMERRLETAQGSLARLTAHVQEVERTNEELKERCDMLTKAVAGKDSALESGNRRAANLLDRIEQMNARFQQERAEFETKLRRMIEELQNERAERSLAKGALEIARQSRVKLMGQYKDLKRQTGGGGPLNPGNVADAEPETKPLPPDNVTAFRPLE